MGLRLEGERIGGWLKDPDKSDISTVIHLLGDILGEVISELESPELFAIEESIRNASKDRRAGDAKAAKQLEAEVEALDIVQARGVSAAFTTYFELVNLAEEQIRVENLRERILSNKPPGESILDAIAHLKKEGINSEQMQTMLDDLSIELVLTAHPTEARRRTVVSKLQRLTRLLDEIFKEPISEHQEMELRESIHAEVASLWLTDAHRTERPQVEDEVRTGLQFVESVFWDILPVIYDDLHDALASYYPEVVSPSNWLHLASWMGGDRDGNPNVDHEVTAETLRLHRGLAVETHRSSLQDLARRLSISSRRLPPQPELTKWIESRGELPEHVKYIAKRYPDEPYRLVLSLLAADLAKASSDDMTARLLERNPDEHEARMKLPDLLKPLDLILAGLPASIAQDEIRKVRYQLHIFGLHSMRLDIREESSRYNSALGETLRALNISPNFPEMPDEERLALLTKLLSSSLPSLADHPGITAATAETWVLFQLIKRVRDLYGAELLGPVVISMCRSAADILSVLLLARWTKCDENLQIVPLFETIEDLRDASSILESLFTLEVYREHLASSGNQQMVMIGYSDSNKDGGYVMANWSLYQGQENITKVAQKHDVILTIFHGRGGTIARGGGPANRAIRAQPPGSIDGRFRLTEQGETIASRYSNPELAHRHLEQVVNAVLVASSPTKTQAEIPGAWRAGMDEMSAAAFKVFRQLVYETPEFIDFWQAATPLDEIKSMHIGSRPAARTQSSEVSKIRAIPWVFSWMQSRFNLPGWYGLGTALESVKDSTLLQDMYQGWPFFKTMLDNTEMSLLKADMGIAALYVDLVPDKAMAGEIFTLIRAEYKRTRDAVLSISGHQNLLDEEPITQQAVQLRNPYVDPLNYVQVEMLRRLRALPNADGDEADDLREVIRLTINGIAAGLRNTG